ncbi:MAG TPA: hypothetical protein VF246_10640 [Acidimicrobiia bacterium]
MITHHGRIAATLRGDKAVKFRASAALLDHGALQLLMARLTGNYKRGDERR